MRLGVFGGTFDPVHLGHLVLAELCREQCRLDEIWFVPAGNPPHKVGAALTPGPRRAEMLELAIAGHSQFKVDRRELDRSGPSYTVHTLQELANENPANELFFLVGADSLIELPQWYEPRRIAELATLVAVNRGRSGLPDLSSLVPHLGSEAVGRIQNVSIPAIDISASELRRRVQQGLSIRYQVPRSVECYIGEHHLYPS